MDFNKLQTFVKVSELQSISEAARQIRRSQSAVSQQIQLLEDELGLKLLERKAGRIYLSKHGEDVLALCQSRLGAIADGIADLRHEATLIEGRIRLGILNDYGNDIDYGTLLGSFCQQFPKIQFSLIEGTSTSLEQDLIANRIDLSFQVYFQTPEMFVQIPITKQYHSLYTSPRYAERHGPLDSFRKILECHLIDLTDDFICIGTYFKKNAPKLAPSLAHRLPDIAAPNHRLMKQATVSGYGIAILPDYFVENELTKGKLIKLMPSALPVFAGLDLAYRSHRTLRLCETVFIDFVKKQYKKGRP